MSKGSEILTRLAGIASMIASVGFFANIGSVDKFVVPGLLFGASGLWMLVRRGDRRPALPDPDVQQRLARLQEGLTLNQQELAAVQEQLGRIVEERDFLRQLATPQRRSVPEPQRPADVPPSPRAAELPGAQPRTAESTPPA